MTIDVYSKPGCGKCEAAKKKLKILGLNYNEHNLEYHVSLHEGWRQDGSTDVMAAHNIMDTLPLFRVNGQFHDYPTAMRVIKSNTEIIPVQTLVPAMANA